VHVLRGGRRGLLVAPFPVEAAPSIRDAAMYAIAVVLVLWLYCSREVHIWHVSPHPTPAYPNPPHPSLAQQDTCGPVFPMGHIRQYCLTHKAKSAGPCLA